MDRSAEQEEETTPSFSAADLLEVVDNGFTVQGGGTIATEFSLSCWNFLFLLVFFLLLCQFAMTFLSKSVEYFTTQPQYNSKLPFTSSPIQVDILVRILFLYLSFGSYLESIGKELCMNLKTSVMKVLSIREVVNNLNIRTICIVYYV